ncbi:MAG: shikimate dehydrogenase [Deltaproteobacteria bacterium]|jgi:shikimate dehydrogenase|nr:shikimate dehydrogenase [Deltaproteobacteria bacterium]
MAEITLPWHLGLLGDERVLKSPSPLMHEAALEAAGLRGRYLPLKLDRADLPLVLKGLWTLGFQGLNVTAPLKEAVLEHLVSQSPEARAIGAVNTLIRTAEGYAGHNTDGPGFAAAFLQDRDPRQKVLLYGAGGAARAVLQAFTAGGFSVSVCARTLEKAEKLAAEFGQTALAPEQIPAFGPADILVAAVSASSASDLDPPLAASFNPGALVIDLNYGRPDNYWAALAAGQGSRFSDGLPMLAQQARLSFNCWTRAGVSLDPFTRALEVYLNRGV